MIAVAEVCGYPCKLHDAGCEVEFGIGRMWKHEGQCRHGEHRYAVTFRDALLRPLTRFQRHAIPVYIIMVSSWFLFGGILPHNPGPILLVSLTCASAVNIFSIYALSEMEDERALKRWDVKAHLADAALFSVGVIWLTVFFVMAFLCKLLGAFHRRFGDW